MEHNWLPVINSLTTLHNALQAEKSLNARALRTPCRIRLKGPHRKWRGARAVVARGRVRRGHQLAAASRTRRGRLAEGEGPSGVSESASVLPLGRASGPGVRGVGPASRPPPPVWVRVAPVSGRVAFWKTMSRANKVRTRSRKVSLARRHRGQRCAAPDEITCELVPFQAAHKLCLAGPDELCLLPS